MSAVVQLIPVLNTITINLNGLSINGGYMNDATVTATLVTPSGSTVSEINNLTLTYASGSNGDYSATVTITSGPTLGSGYTLKIDAQNINGRLHIEPEAAIIMPTS